VPGAVDQRTGWGLYDQAATPPMVITAPMRAAFQPGLISRLIPRNGPRPDWTSARKKFPPSRAPTTAPSWTVRESARPQRAGDDDVSRVPQ
jgi:hypothetical protein